MVEGTDEDQAFRDAQLARLADPGLPAPAPAAISDDAIRESVEGHQLRVVDVIPAGTGDARGLSAFYLTVGWMLGGYLVATGLSISRSARSNKGSTSSRDSGCALSIVTIPCAFVATA